MNKQAQVQAAFLLKEASVLPLLSGLGSGVGAVTGALRHNENAKADDAFEGYVRGGLRGGLTGLGGLAGGLAGGGLAAGLGLKKDDPRIAALILSGLGLGGLGGHVGSRALLGEYGHKSKSESKEEKED